MKVNKQDCGMDSDLVQMLEIKVTCLLHQLSVGHGFEMGQNKITR